MQHDLCTFQTRLRLAPVQFQIAQRLIECHLCTFKFKFGGGQLAFECVDLEFCNDVALLDQVIAFEEDGADASIGAQKERLFLLR